MLSPKAEFILGTVQQNTRQTTATKQSRTKENKMTHRRKLRGKNGGGKTEGLLNSVVPCGSFRVSLQKLCCSSLWEGMHQLGTPAKAELNVGTVRQATRQKTAIGKHSGRILSCDIVLQTLVAHGNRHLGCF